MRSGAREHSVQQMLWKCSKFFSTIEFKFAFKTALAISVCSLPNFLEQFKDVYTDWRGEWTVFTVVLMMSVIIEML
jgi:hypothetical protein